MPPSDQAKVRSFLARVARAVATLMLSCAPAEATTVLWPDISEDELVFLALIDGAGLENSHGRYRFADLTESPDPPVIREFLRPEATLLDITLDPSAIAEAVPGFRWADAAALRLGWSNSAC